MYCFCLFSLRDPDELQQDLQKTLKLRHLYVQSLEVNLDTWTEFQPFVTTEGPALQGPRVTASTVHPGARHSGSRPSPIIDPRVLKTMQAEELDLARLYRVHAG